MLPVGALCLYQAHFGRTGASKMGHFGRIFATLCFIGRMFHLELGVDFDRGFSNGFSHPDIFLPFSVFGHAHKVSKSVTKSVSCHRKHTTKNLPQNPTQNPSLWAEKSIAKSVTTTRKIHCNSTQLRRAPYVLQCLRIWEGMLTPGACRK